MAMIAIRPHPTCRSPIQICCGPAIQMIQIKRTTPTPVVMMAATERRWAGGTRNHNHSKRGPQPAGRSPVSLPIAYGPRTANREPWTADRGCGSI